jgi:hypothetical protein
LCHGYQVETKRAGAFAFMPLHLNSRSTGNLDAQPDGALTFLKSPL